MNKHRLLITAVLLALVLMPGAGPSYAWVTAKNFEKMMNEWNNQSFTSFVVNFGAPNSTYDLSDGWKVQTFLMNQGSRLSLVPVGSTYIGRQVDYSCKVSVYVNPDNVIRQIRWEGAGCVSAPPKR